MATVYSQNLLLPWSSSLQDDARFRQILLTILAVVLALSVIIPFLSVPEVKREKLEELPPQLAKILLQKKKQPPKPISKIKPKPKPKKKLKKPELKPEPKKPIEIVKKARQKAARSGLLALQDELADMRQDMNIAAVIKQPLSKGDTTAAKTDQSLIAMKANSTSGGISTANLSHNIAAVELASHQTTRVAALPPSLGEKLGAQTEDSRSGDALPRRSEESIRSVLDQNKGAIYAIYNRALRKDPNLEGKVIVQVVIDSDGIVLSCKVISSELGDTKLERKLVARIRLINFGSFQVAQTTFNYTFDFLPY